MLILWALPVKPAADSISCFLLRWLWVLCLFVKLRRHSLCALSPSDTTTVWPRSLLALLMVSFPLWLAWQSSHPNQWPLLTVHAAPWYSRTRVLEKKIARLTCRMGFLPLHKAQCLHTHTHTHWHTQLERSDEADLHTHTHTHWHTQLERSDEADKKTIQISHVEQWLFAYIYYSHKTVASSMNTAGPVLQ